MASNWKGCCSKARTLEEMERKDQKVAATPEEPLILLPRYAIDTLGAALCGEDETTGCSLRLCLEVVRKLPQSGAIPLGSQKHVERSSRWTKENARDRWIHGGRMEYDCLTSNGWKGRRLWVCCQLRKVRP